MIWFLLGALALGVLSYLGVLLTIRVIHNFRIRKNSKILIADMEEFIRNMPEKDKHTMSFEDLEKCQGQQFVTEFDPITQEVIQTKSCDKGMDEPIFNAVKSHKGYIIVGD